jgi:ABC-2 type transport system permease protein
MHFRELLHVSLISELRQQNTQKKKRRIPFLVRSLLFYLIMGFSFAFSLITRASPSLYTLLSYSYFMLMSGFAVVLECSQVLLIPDDLDILGHRPISSSTFFLARVSHLLIFILIFSTVLSIGPTVVSFFLGGTPASFPLSFWGGAFLTILFTASLTIFLYSSLLGLVKYEKLRSLVMVIQLIFTGILVFLYQWIARTGWEYSMMNFRLEETWIRWLPPAWFASIVESIYNPSSKTALYSLAIFAGFLVMLILGFRRISLSYLQNVSLPEQTLSVKLQSEQPMMKRERFWSGWILKILHHPETRAGFYLTFNLLYRDRSVKMTLLPVMMPPVVILFWGLFDGSLKDPFTAGLSTGNGPGSMQLIPFFIAFLIYMIIHGSGYSADWEAAWVYDASPIASSLHLRRGVRSGLLLGLIVPFYLILTILILFRFFWLHALQHVFYLAVLGGLFASLISRKNNDFPFSKKREKGERIGGMSFLLLLIPFEIAAIFLHMLAYRNQKTWLVTFGGLLIVWFILEIVGKPQGNRRAKPEFDKT